MASKFLSVGAVVPFARAGVGAVATQSFANLAYGPEGLTLLEGGRSATEVARVLTDADEERAKRQLGVADARGGVATFTGDECLEWAGGRTGEGYACQGNVLAGPEVVDDMVTAFETTEGRLAERLVAALDAGDRAGGDRRGRQSAALLTVRKKGGYGGGSDVSADLRVDDQAAPVTELHRLLELHRLMYPQPEDLTFVPLDRETIGELEGLLPRAGFAVPPGADADAVKSALYDFVGMENLEERWSEEPKVEVKVLDALRRRAEAEGS